MCCFSRSVRHVSSTRIFARPLDGARQLLVYGMTLEIAEDVAMILPIPVPPNSPEDAVRFVDLSACPTFFEELASLFPVDAAPLPAAFGMQSRQLAPQSMLVVQDVGDFEASFVPTVRDFGRLDARFRLSIDVWEQLPSYLDWGFCVFKLKGAKRSGSSGLFGLFKMKAEGQTKKVHPMAFEFPRRDPAALFYPTVHVHDGEVHPTAEFDHELYCQAEPAWEALMDWERSASRSDALAGGAEAWVVPESWLYRRKLSGEHPNRDTLLVEARLRARTAVSEHFRVRMRATWEHVVDDGKTELDPRVKKWLRVSEAERMRIRDALVATLAPVFAEHAEAWELAPFAHDLVQLTVAPSLPGVAPGLEPGAQLAPAKQADVERRGCMVAFFVSNERVEPQEIDVAFRAIPTAETRDAVRVALEKSFERATSS
jgi:hypothetical protein